MEYINLKEICSIRTGKLDANAAVENGKYPFFTCAKEPSKIDTYAYDCDCVLLAGNGEFNVNMYSGKFNAYQRTYIIEVLDCKKYSLKFVYYLIKNSISHFKKVSNGGIIKFIKLGDIQNIQFPNISRDEQDRIVSELECLDNNLLLNTKQIGLHDELIKSRFIEMFGDPIENNYNFPKGIIGDYIVDVRYGTSKPAKDGGNYQYLRMNNLTYDGYLDYENVKYIDATDEDIDKYGIKYGDVLFNRTNSIDLIGKTAVYLENEIKIVAGYIIRVRFNECINPIYFTRYMNLPSTKKILREMAKGAVNQANINAQELKGISLIAPPMPLQDEFASFVEQIDKLKFSLQEQIKSLQELLDSKMQEYFGG